MQKTLSLFACLFTIFIATDIFAQYPEYKWINPYPRISSGDELVDTITFDRPEIVNECEGLHDCTLEATGKTLKIISSGADPYFTLPKLKKPIKGPVRIVLRMSSTMNSGGELFWMSANHPGPGADRSGRFDTENDGKSHEYSFVIPSEETFTRFRFDPGTSDGEAKIEKIEIYSAILAPLEITKMFSNNDYAEVELTNHLDQFIDAELIFGAERETKRIPPGKTVLKSNFPKKEPFESIYFNIAAKEYGLYYLSRTFHAFHEDVETDWVVISCGKMEYLFAKDGSGAKVYRDKKLLGIINQFAYEDDWLPPNPGLYDPVKMANVSHAVPFGSANLTLKSHDGKSIEFCSDPHYKNQPVRSLRFDISHNDTLHITRDSERLFGPVFKPFGKMEQAVLCGVEYLEKGEHSSSTADLETPEHVRIFPPPLHVTVPFMGIITDKCSFGLLWNNPEDQPFFAIPDYIEGKQPGDPLQYRMGVHGGGTESKPFEVILRIGHAYGEKEHVNTGSSLYDYSASIETAILWAVSKHGLPRLPEVPRDAESQRKLSLSAFEKSIICGKDGNWQHAGIPGGPVHFPYIYGSDFVSCIWQLTGELPEVPRLDHGGGHIPNYVSYLLMNKADRLLELLNSQAENVRKSQRPDGSFGYSGIYKKGHWSDTSSGHCANNTHILFEHWRLTGSKDSLEAGLKGLEYINELRTPRGAQVWELSLHTPDIMGSSRCVLSNVTAFEATGEAKYLESARRWAISGLPFVYLWEKPLARKEHPVMLYATIPVFGATNWNAPNWIGLPVQWCGLDYAEALFRLAPHDVTLDWKKIAEGIVISGEIQQYPDGPSIGLLPDSYTLKSQKPNPYDIHPCTLVMLRRKIKGELESVDIQTDESGKRRIVSPYRTKIEDGSAIIEAKEGTVYQVIINGTPKTVESKGIDRISLE